MSETTRPRSKPGRPSQIEDPEFAKMVAELFAAGLSRQAMIDELESNGVVVKDKDTISRWRKDARVKVHIQQITADRTIQISRKIDSIIEGRLSQAEKLDIRDLIAIRKEYGGASVARTDVADDSVTAGAIKRMEEDPEYAIRLQKFIQGATDVEEPESSPVVPDSPFGI